MTIILKDGSKITGATIGRYGNAVIVNVVISLDDVEEITEDKDDVT